MSTPSILVVDDEKSIRRTLREILEYEGYEVEEAEDGEQALEKAGAGRYDLVVLDVKMPKRDGIDVLKSISETKPELPVVMISGHGTIETAVEATKLGAFDFIEKPPDLNRLLLTVRNALDRGQLVVENRRMRQKIQETSVPEILGTSAAIGQIKKMIERVGPTEARVLITGEAGTGKELVAHWIHEHSNRSKGSLVEVNCAAIPSELIESELFGHEKGAFTGASKQHIGKFELADGGTIFLDEIGDMGYEAQAKVLRALQESRIIRVGGDKMIPVDVRVVAATNRDLGKMVEAGEFRNDLYDRLAVILIHVPPLRDRREDVPILAEAFLDRLAKRNGLDQKSFSDGALKRLRQLDWRGNVRELHNVIERLLILTDGEVISEADIDLLVQPSGAKGDALGSIIDECEQFADFRDMAEKLFIERRLEQYDWNVSKTAEAIGIQRSHLYNKLNKYSIERRD